MTGITVFTEWMTMMSRVIALVLVTTSATFGENDPLDVRVVGIGEVRYVDLDPGKSDNGFGAFSWDATKQPGLTLSLRLTGEAAERATHYGFIEVSSAKTDQGEELKLVKGSNFSFSDPHKEFVLIDRNMMFMGMSDKPEDELAIDLKFSVPSRVTKRIEYLDGSLKLLTGEKQDVVFKRIQSKTGQVLTNPILEQAGVSIKINEPGQAMLSSGNHDREINLQLSGKVENILGIEVVDSHGVSMVSSSMSSTFGGSTTRVIETTERIGPGSRLKVQVVINTETVLVPLKIRALAMP